MFEPHIIESELKLKMDALFAYRHFPTIIGPSYNENNDFVKRLYQLQASIYHLDAHLEAHWNTSENALHFHWTNMQQHLTAFGISENDVENYLSHIAKYQKHELDLRKGIFPMKYDMEYFYFYKSCDVKLLRRLIYELWLDDSKQFGSLSDWRYFDLITEVNDDVEDIFEDMDYINGNSFLLSILMEGKDATSQKFLDFIVNVKNKVKKKIHVEKRSFVQSIHKLTLQNADTTIELMKKNLTLLTEDKMMSSELFKHINFAKV
ncbi:MAG: hypothetical protein R2774_09500 [Saprospiraceae bacterium]